MSKPEWLINTEQNKKRLELVKYCSQCRYFGKVVKQTKHKGKEWVDVHECAIHPGCFNTKYSVCCGDRIAF